MPRKQRVLPVSNEKSFPVVQKVQPTTSLGQIVKEGMAFGVGNAIAHNVVHRLFGGSSTVVPEKTEYEKCMESSSYTMIDCTKYLSK